MLRPPSNQHPYNDHFSGDPAFVQPPANATKAQLEEHARKVEVARETGDWKALLIEGQQPTTFVMRPLKGNTFRNLVDDSMADKIGGAMMAQLAFRAAIESIANLGDVQIARQNDPRFGEIATVDVTDTLDAISPKIVGELGSEAVRRARTLSPKS